MLKLLSVLAIFSSSSYATIMVKAIDCPSQFEGRVQEIIESVGPNHSFETVSVVFKNQQTIKGDLPEQIAVEVLKHGPHKFELGEDYRIQTRSGRLCAVEAL